MAGAPAARSPIGQDSLMSDRASDVQRARALSVVSVVAGIVAAIAGALIGVTTGSLAVLGFAIDSAIDSAASMVLTWRFTTESRDPERAVRVEHAAERVVGIVLLVAATSLAVGAARALLAHETVTPSTAQLVLLAVSLLVLPPLAFAKWRVARRLSSAALRNDALLTGAAALLAGVALLAVGLATSGLWWADAAGSLVIAVVLGREGLTSVRLSRSRAGPAPQD
jgi:divalent metal cation (Fe/Co/Zn/Cd) transporter